MRRYLPVMLLCLAGAANLHGQGLTGRISGVVQDTHGAVTPGVKLELVNSGTGQRRDVATDSTGAYVFAELLPGTYEISISADGFKRYTEKNIVLGATERLVVRPIKLQLGDLSQTISVTADAPQIQSQSAERSGVIGAKEIQELGLKGRDYVELLSLLPGVVDTGTREAPGWNNIGGITINGSREGTLNLTIDGVSNRDTGSGTGPYLAPGIDAIGELKVLLSNYQAEYGRSSGGSVNVVIKNGTKQFHGGAFYFLRNEALNANGFFFNRDGLERAPYRFTSPGYNIGGPIKAGGPRFKDRLFFFWSQEFTPRRTPTRVGRLNMPTALEREGDFSKTLELNGALTPVRDPLNNKAQFPGNIIPKNRFDPAGQALLKLLPLPNNFDPQRTFNTVFQSTVGHPRRDEILRLDWNAGSKTTFYVRAIHDVEAFRGDFNFTLASNVWPQLPIDYSIHSRGLVGTVISTLSPTIINEFTFGVNHAAQDVVPLNQAGLDRNQRDKLGIRVPQVHPEINPYNLIPNASFGGITSAPSFNIETRFPFRGRNTTWNWNDNVSKIWRTHTLKAGITVEQTSRDASRASNFNGNFNFGRSSLNPTDTNNAYSNALIGSVNSYTESDAHPSAHGRFRNVEWFTQDNYRLGHRFTLDMGVRFYSIQPTWSAGDKLAYFAPEEYRQEKAPLLIVPYRATPGATRVGLNPLTGQTVSEVLIGTFVPGSGDFYNGMRLFNEHVVKTPPIQVAPRFGFAWDVFGNGKTALRGGFGIYPDRFSDDQVLVLVEQPPLLNNFAAYNTTIQALVNTPLTQSPANVLSIQTRYKPPTVYNWSFGIQRDIGFKTSLDVAYVGSVARHLLQRRQLNAFPYGTNFQPNVVDPSVRDVPLPPNFLRPMRGYGDIGYIEFASSSNYHSMQTRVNRRFSRNFTFGATWTWSKAMDLTDGQNDYVNPFLDFRMRNYGKAGFDRTHNFSLNFLYDLPKFSRYWNHGFSRGVFDGWEVTGITRFISGRPLGFTYSFVQSTDVTGTSGVAGVDSRVILIGDPNLPKGERSVERHFRTEVVRPPERSNFGIGNAAKDAIRGPGVNNWDLSLFKNMKWGRDAARRIQLRGELYNAFNHTQFDGVDTAARFDAQGRQANRRFGQYTSARDGRRVQLGLKFYF
jgi:hypothetical protein